MTRPQSGRPEPGSKVEVVDGEQPTMLAPGPPPPTSPGLGKKAVPPPPPPLPRPPPIPKKAPSTPPSTLQTPAEPPPDARPSKSSWGPPTSWSTAALNEAVTALEQDLRGVMRDLRQGPLEDQRASAANFVRELRMLFLRHQMRVAAELEAEGDASPELLIALLRREKAELAERWRMASLERAQSLAEAGWSPLGLVHAVDEVVARAPEEISAVYEASSFESRDDDGLGAGIKRSWLGSRHRRLAARDKGGIQRLVRLRSLATYHLSGRVPTRLEEIASLMIDAEEILAARTRALFEAIVDRYESMAQDATLLEPALLRTSRPPPPPLVDPTLTAAKKKLIGTSGPPLSGPPASSRVDGTDTVVSSRPHAPLASGLRHPGPTVEATRRRLGILRKELDAKFSMISAEVAHVTDSIAAHAASIVGETMAELKADLAIVGTFDLADSERAPELRAKERGEALQLVADQFDAARRLVGARYSAVALSLELVVLHGRAQDALAAHGDYLERVIRGRTHIQIARVLSAIDDSLERYRSTLTKEMSGAELASAIHAIAESLEHVVRESTVATSELREELGEERAVLPLLDALTRATQTLAEQYVVPSDPPHREELRLPTSFGTTPIAFRDLVTAHIEASVAPAVVATMKQVTSQVHPAAEALDELDRLVAFNAEFAVSELETYAGEGISSETRELVSGMIIGSLERVRPRIAELAEKSEDWGTDARFALGNAVLGALDRLSSELVDGHASEMRVRLLRQAAEGRRWLERVKQLPRRAADLYARGRHLMERTVGEERLARARRVLGLPEPAAEASPDPSAFAPPARASELPVVYRRLFAAQALEAGDMFLTRKAELARARAALTEHAPGRLRAVALVAIEGTGEDALASALSRSASRRVRRIDLTAPATVEDVSSWFTSGDNGELTVVTGLHWLFSMRPSGFSPLRRFAAGVVADGGRNAWLISADRLVWELAIQISPLREAFPEVIPLKPLPPSDLEKAVLARNAMSGYQPRFELEDLAESNVEQTLLRVMRLGREPQEAWFHDLHAASGGLLRDALRLWMGSIVKFDEPTSTVHIGPIPKTPMGALRRLSEDVLLTLHETARQGWTSADIHAGLFRTDVATASAHLGRLVHLGLLESSEGRYRVAAHLRGAVTRVLIERGWAQ